MSDDDPIVTVTYKPSQVEYRRVLMRRQRRAVWISGIFLIIVAFSGVFLLIWLNRETIRIATLLPAIVPIALVGSIFLFRAIIVPRSLAKRIVGNLDEMTFKFCTSGFVVETPQASTRANWETFKKVEETNGDILLFSKTNTIFPISKDRIDSGDLIKIRALLKEKLGGKAKLK